MARQKIEKDSKNTKQFSHLGVEAHVAEQLVQEKKPMTFKLATDVRQQIAAQGARQGTFYIEALVRADIAKKAKDAKVKKTKKE